MIPAQSIYELYEAGSPRTFREDLEAHLCTGYVFATPQYMLMGRAVKSTADPDEIRNPWHAFRRSDQDCWFIYAYAGRGTGLVKTCLTHLPYLLPLVSWERKKDTVLRFYQLNHETLSLHPVRAGRPLSFQRGRQTTEGTQIRDASHASDPAPSTATAPAARGPEHVLE